MTGIVVYDLEYTTWTGARERRWSGPGEHREVVQIGAVRLDDGAELSLLVKPRINPRLSAYFTDLTGVTQDQVDRHGMDFPEALGQLADFATGARLASNGADEDVLRENCDLNGTDFPFDRRCRDLAPLLMAAAGAQAHIYSCEMAATFGLATDQQSHDALGDARQVAQVLRHLFKTGRVLPSDLL
ncbi:conserved protein of unknown function （contain Ribonuclease H-like domain&|uniref:3'-5' exonuclease n=1 Tax=Magnetospirillum sp. XM-1 TaxID=1663591 RepID=UPI00073DC03E|nr:3'-5' exonuclease [Magnetospirillum sp. XM-1]CUW37959.1 conserved protein of unknown function \